MNTFWLKIAGIAVGVVVVIILIGTFTGGGGESKPPEPEKGIYDQWEEDEKRLTAEPQYEEPPESSAPAQQSSRDQTVRPTIPTQTRPGPEPVEPPKPQFKKLSLEDEVQAQRLWEWVKNQRKMGRLPVMGFGQMVKTCREIIRRWPQSEYAFYAKRALGEIPERYRKMYNITKEEIDLGNLK